MRRITNPAGALLACGAVAGPVYVCLTIAQALTRQGFDLSRHRFSWLTAGELGWIQRSNMLLVGVLTMLLALGVREVMKLGPGGLWGPRLLGTFGAAYSVGGLLKADRVLGFPPGTTAEMVATTWQGVAQNGSRGASTILLILACVVIARWFSAEGERGWAWFYRTSFPGLLAILTVIGSVVFTDYRRAFAVAILSTPWIVVTTLSIQLYQRHVGRFGTPQTAR